MKIKPKDAIQSAIEYGIDVTLLYETLSQTPTERIEHHQGFLEDIEELRKAGERKHGKVICQRNLDRRRNCKK